ncbi:MAG: insulinase family protein, partial [Muribaculaceae bacterium]|nr:insulinase family protein [Muribaculaceae bacterium]
PRALPSSWRRQRHMGIISSPVYALIRLAGVCPTGAMEYAPSVATMYGRMLKEGSINFKAAEIAETLDFNGAAVVAAPSNHNIVISLTALRRNIDKVLPVFFDLLASPVFPEKELEAVKRQMLVELKCNRETPSYNAREHMRHILGGEGHRYGMKESESGIMQIDRDMLESCRRRCLDPRNIAVFIAGYADKALTDEIDSRLESIDDCGCKPVIYDLPFTPLPAGVRKVHVEGSLQNCVLMATLVDARNTETPDYWALRLGTHALGGYFGSRLMQNIREDKGYTYGINAGISRVGNDAFVSISCDCDPAYTEGVLKETAYELERFATEPMGADELHRLRLSLASRLAGMCDTPMKIQSQYISQYIHGQSADYYNQFWAALDHITPQQMSEAVGRYLLAADSYTVIAGDFNK